MVQLGTLNAFTEASIEKKYNTFAENLDHIFATYKSKIGDYDLVIIFSVCTVIDYKFLIMILFELVLC